MCHIARSLANNDNFYHKKGSLDTPLFEIIISTPCITHQVTVRYQNFHVMVSTIPQSVDNLSKRFLNIFITIKVINENLDSAWSDTLSIFEWKNNL